MSKHYRLPIILASLLIVLGLAAQGVRAEVAAQVDPRGNYLLTRVDPVGEAPTLRIWSLTDRPLGLRGRTVPLNVDGDLEGDLWPEIGESVVAPHHPWVVWSRDNGEDFDLIWSRWSDRGWEAVQWLEPEPALGDDLDPSVSFDPDGRPYLVWWRDEYGLGQVYFSMFLATQWMGGFVLTNPSVDARYPTINMLGFGEFEVTYDTPSGAVTQLVAFDWPVTITDDINPQNHIVQKAVVLAPDP
jgi:hypothetical protein